MNLFPGNLPTKWSHDSFTHFRERSFVASTLAIPILKTVINLVYQPVSDSSRFSIEFDRLRRTISMPSHAPLAPQTLSDRSIPLVRGEKQITSFGHSRP